MSSRNMDMSTACLSFSLLKMALVEFLIFISIFHVCFFNLELAFEARTGETGGVKHPLLPERIWPPLALLDYGSLWYGSCGVEIQEIVACVCVDCPNPGIKPIEMLT